MLIVPMVGEQRSSVSAIKIVRRRRNPFLRQRLCVAQRKSLAAALGKIIEIGRFLRSSAINTLQIQPRRVKIFCSVRSGRCVFESGFISGQIVIEKLAQVDKTGGRKITPSRPPASILRNVLHPRRQLTKMRLVVTGERPAEQPGIIRAHKRNLRHADSRSRFTSLSLSFTGFANLSFGKAPQICTTSVPGNAAGLPIGAGPPDETDRVKIR